MLDLSNLNLSSKLPERWKNLKLACGIFWASNPKSARLVLMLTMLEGVLPLALVHATQYAVNSYNDTPEFSEWLGGPALVYVGIFSLSQIGIFLVSYFRLNHDNSVSDHMDSAIQEKATTADMIAFESSEFYDRLYRAGFESEDHVLDIVEKLILLVSRATTLVGLFWIVARFEWWIPLLFCAASIPLIATLLLHAKARYQWSRTWTQTERESRYYNGLLLGDETAGEVRIFGLRDHFRKHYKELRSKILQARLTLHKKQSIHATLAHIVSISLLSIGMLFMADKVQSGEISMGSAALFAHSCMLCFTSVKSVVRESASLYRSSLYLTDLGFILEMKPKIKAPAKPSILPNLVDMKITFKNVIFSYPNATRPALDDITTTIPAQKITLIYGENGSGKSTISKLIYRFFDPDSGIVSFGGKDIREYDPHKLRAQFGVVFQDAVRYYCSLKENVTLGRVDGPFSESQYEAAVKNAELQEMIKELPDNENTNLGRYFQSGTQLSSGQWQRLALARLHYSDRPIMILDEPTSAMDPWTEKKWLKSLKKNSKDKTVIIITHRLSTAQIADHVIVLKKGKVAESGPPDDLKKHGGYFAGIEKSNMRQF